MLASLFSVGAASILGGITGLIGGIFNRVMDFKQKKEDNKFEILKLEKEQILLGMEIKRDVDKASIERDMTISTAELDALKHSIDSDKATYTLDGSEKYPWVAKGLALVDIVRGFTRPFLTLYLDMVLTIIAVVLVLHFISLDVALLTSDEVSKILLLLLDALIYLATTATGWWFGSRGKKIKLL